MAGVAPQATILPISALDPAGYGDSSTVARGIIAAADAGARVINLSLGGPDRDPVLDEACAYAFAKGAVVVAAGGNSYLTGNQVQYPAASPNVLAVASVDRTGNPSASPTPVRTSTSPPPARASWPPSRAAATTRSPAPRSPHPTSLRRWPWSSPPTPG